LEPANPAAPEIGNDPGLAGRREAGLDFMSDP
jgi:hypothetical protein